MGTLAVIFGAVSFFWLRFKKKLTSKSPLVKRLAKGLYKVHQVSGWAALLLVAAHGVYYLITKLHDDKIFSGLAAFAILLAIGGYGWFIRRYRTHPWMRKVHMTLSIVWIPALVLHAGGSAIITVLVTAVLWGTVGLVEKASRTHSAVHEA
ncbi:hypothetical protein CF651_28465 [Paenibacillus rigui]|uniref:Ferric oxidoreductase domain-containing protein n=2 Tax=Paenibacillus rigui TaxID=554312 RepID=A0A229UHQ0_9BACL|nr:hypothetical protein CF651_28465 [Paenibacillus rigui]